MGVLLQAGDGSAFEGQLGERAPAVAGEHHDLGIGHLIADPRRGLRSVHDRHGEVHQDDVGLEGYRELERLAAVRRLGDDLEVRAGGQKGLEPGADEVMVVG